MGASRFPLHTTVYNPLAGGLFAHPLDAARTPGARLEASALYRRRHGSPALLELARSLREIATSTGLSLATLAYAWLLGRPGVDSVLVGPATVAHLEVALDAAAVTLEPEVLSRIDGVYLAFTETDARYAR